MKYIICPIYQIYFPRHLKGVRNSERWVASKMYYICQNIDCKIIEGSEILNPALDAKCTTFAKISIAEGSEILNPALDAKCITLAKISIAKLLRGQKF